MSKAQTKYPCRFEVGPSVCIANFVRLIIFANTKMQYVAAPRRMRKGQSDSRERNTNRALQGTNKGGQEKEMCLRARICSQVGAMCPSRTQTHKQHRMRYVCR